MFEEYLGLPIREPEKGLPEEETARQRAHFLGTCARHLFALRETLLGGLEARRLKDLFFNLELPLVGVLAKMELRGIRVREDIWDKLAAEMDESMALLEKEIMELAGEEFNLNSPRQLSYILFEKLKLPVIRRIKTGYSTDARVLQELSAIHPVAAKIMEYRTVAKLKTTYLEGLRPLINPETGKIHTTFNQTVTATGRLSSKDPNLQNIPVRLEEGRRLRQAFIPSSEDSLLLSADYSQIELRIMAHLSRDPNLMDAFLKDQDIHSRTAAEVFNVSLEEVTPLMRNRAKAVNFGIIYGISDYGLSQDLQIPRAEARKYIENYFNRYTGVKRYVDECIKMARENGYVTTVMDRRRYLPDINHSNYSRRSFAERIARNMPVQGSAADIIKSAMLSIDREFEKKGLRAAMLLQVHDELIFEVPPEELDEVAARVKNLMEGVFPLAVPLKVDLKVGRDWYHLDPLEGG
jgi:DNA polymerase-1